MAKTHDNKQLLSGLKLLIQVFKVTRRFIYSAQM